MEAILNVEPYDVLEVVVGAGGQAGVRGTEIEAVSVGVQRVHARAVRKSARGEVLTEEEATVDTQVIDSSCGVALGGSPGGGEGYGGGGCWAAGGGGGYSIVSKRTLKGNQALLVAAGDYYPADWPCCNC